MNFSVSDSHCFLLSTERVDNFGDSGYESTEKGIKGYVQNILKGGKLSDIASKHNISIDMIVVLSNLCNTYKQLDTELSQSKALFDSYKIKKIIYVIEALGISNIPELSRFIESTPGSLYLPSEILQAIFDLPKIEDFNSFKDIIEECPKHYILLAIGTYIFHLDGINSELENNFRKISNKPIPGLQQYINLCSSLDELIGLLRNEKLVDIFAKIGGSRLAGITRFCSSAAEFLELVNDDQFIGSIASINTGYFQMASGLCKNIQELRKISGNRYLRTSCGGFNASRVLSDMTQSHIDDCDFCELKYLRNQVRVFLDSQLSYSSRQERQLGDYELNVYVRLGGTVDHPEIAEALIILVQEYINRGGSKLFGKINIVPREVHNKPSRELFQNERTTYLRVSGVSFNKAMNKKKTACVYLSHSGLSHNDAVPSIISGGMENHRINNAIVSNIELEDSKDPIGFAAGENLDTIFEEFLGNLKELENSILAGRKKPGIAGMVKKVLLPFS